MPCKEDSNSQDGRVKAHDGAGLKLRLALRRRLQDTMDRDYIASNVQYHMQNIHRLWCARFVIVFSVFLLHFEFGKSGQAIFLLASEALMKLEQLKRPLLRACRTRSFDWTIGCCYH